MKKVWLSEVELQKQQEEISKHKYVCKHCGHKQLVPNYMEKNLCDWCGYWVFRNDKDEFKFRMNERLKKK